MRRAFVCSLSVYRLYRCKEETSERFLKWKIRKETASIMVKRFRHVIDNNQQHPSQCDNVSDIIVLANEFNTKTMTYKIKLSSSRSDSLISHDICSTLSRHSFPSVAFWIHCDCNYFYSNLIAEWIAIFQAPKVRVDIQFEQNDAWLMWR